jgi:hypothetical protein
MIIIPLTVVRVRVTVVLKEPFLGWRRNCEDCLKISWTGDSAPLLCSSASLCIIAAHCWQSTKFSNCPCIAPPPPILLTWALRDNLYFSISFTYGYFSYLSMLLVTLDIHNWPEELHTRCLESNLVNSSRNPRLTSTRGRGFCCYSVKS